MTWTDATVRAIDTVLKPAPISVPSPAAFTLGKFGVASLLLLAKLVGLVHAGCGLFFVALFGTVAHLARFNLSSDAMCPANPS